MSTSPPAPKRHRVTISAKAYDLLETYKSVLCLSTPNCIALALATLQRMFDGIGCMTKGEIRAFLTEVQNDQIAQEAA